MSPINALKSEAVALRAKEKALGRALKHCDALEQVAKKHGYANWRACCAILEAASQKAASPIRDKAEMNANLMKHYERPEWKFAVDVPERWNSFPPEPTNSPNEVIRFASNEGGMHILIIFRQHHNPSGDLGLEWHVEKVKQVLTSKGFSNFVTAETIIGSQKALTLDFDKPQEDGTWSCRHYFVTEGTLVFALGFGTSRKASMVDLFDRMAKSFKILEGPKEPLNNFTPRAKQVVALARREADRLHHAQVSTAHFLLGLIELGQGPAVSVLKKMGLDLEVVRAAVIRDLGAPSEANVSGRVPYDHAAKKSLAFAGKEAFSLGHSYLGTEHMLLALLRGGDDTAARVLKTFGVDFARTRAEILRELSETTPKSPND
jgi:hypothetical protein